MGQEEVFQTATRMVAESQAEQNRKACEDHHRRTTSDSVHRTVKGKRKRGSEMQGMKDMVNVTRCVRCKYWKNFSVRNEAKPEDMGLCTKYSIVKDAVGYCDMGKEKEDGKKQFNN